MTAAQPTTVGGPTAPLLLSGRLLRGCNVHDRTTVFVQRLVPGVLSGLRVADAGADFARRFIQRFGGLTTRPGADCVPETTRARLQRERELPLTAVLVEAIVAVERFVAAAMGRRDGPRFGTVVPGDGVVDLVWSAHAAWISRAAAGAALTGLIELLPEEFRHSGQPGTRFAAAMTGLHRRALRRQWSPTAAALAVAARRRGLAHELLAGNYLRVGEGITQLMVSEDALGLAAPDHAEPDALLNLILPPGAPATIPTALIVGERGTRAAARRLDRLLRAGRDGVGLSVQGRTTIQGQPVDSTSLSRRWGLRFLLGDPRVRTAISAIAPRRIVAQGLGVDRVSITALLDPVPGSDLELYRTAAAVSLTATTETVVVSAENPFLELVLASRGTERTVIASARRDHPLVGRHAAAGGAVVLLKPGGRAAVIELRRRSHTVARLRLSPREARAARRRPMQALFTAGLAFALTAGGSAER